MTALESEMDSVSDKMGTADDSDGSQTVGSVMAKQNKALADLEALGIDVNSIISKLATGIAAKGIKRMSTKLQVCTYSPDDITNYWQMPFANDGIVILSCPNAGHSNYANGLKIVSVGNYSTDDKGAYFYVASNAVVARVTKSGFALISSVKGTVTILITSIEFN